MDSNQKPCSQCRRRKVRCNKAVPCANCVRLKHQCRYDEDVNTSQSSLTLDEPATAELWERLSRMEIKLSRLHSSTAHDSGQDPHASLVDPSNGQRSPRAGAKTHARPGATSTFPFCSPAKSTSGLNTASVDSERQFNPLLELFLENAEPFIRIVHVPKLRQDLQDYQTGTSTLEFEALLRCIHAVAIVTLPPNFVMEFFGASREDMVAALQRSAEMALQTADFMASADLMVLQGLLYYITVLFERRQSIKASAMIGLALRLALRLGLHLDPSHLSPQLPSLEAEIRRRVWFYLQHLDFRAQEISSVESCTAGPAHWDTALPLNTDDETFDGVANGNLRNPIIQGFTGMTFVIARGRLNHLQKQILDSERGVTLPMSTEETKALIERYEQELELLYLSVLDIRKPIQRLAGQSIRGRLLKIELHARRKEIPTPLDVAEAFQKSLANFDLDPDLARWSWVLPGSPM